MRKAAVEILPDIANVCPPHVRATNLVELFKKFIIDPSKWVKLATLQCLGPFIATLKGLEINRLLIEYYLSMGDPKRSSADNDILYHCAFNFPAVIWTLGRTNWPELSRLYKQLVRDSQWKVRRTLSYSLHEVAKILGPELAEKELWPVLQQFLSDIRKRH